MSAPARAASRWRWRWSCRRRESSPPTSPTTPSPPPARTPKSPGLPAAALFSEGEGLEVTRRLIEEARGALVPKGWLVLELGYDMAGRVQALLGDAWAEVEVTNDLAGIPRVLAAPER